ncbi:MAG: hypothetical protein R2838_02790 [Caldilineaceae bacterium]
MTTCALLAAIDSGAIDALAPNKTTTGCGASAQLGFTVTCWLQHRPPSLASRSVLHAALLLLGHATRFI